MHYIHISIFVLFFIFNNNMYIEIYIYIYMMNKKKKSNDLIINVLFIEQQKMILLNNRGMRDGEGKQYNNNNQVV